MRLIRMAGSVAASAFWAMVLLCMFGRGALLEVSAQESGSLTVSAIAHEITGEAVDAEVDAFFQVLTDTPEQIISYLNDAEALQGVRWMSMSGGQEYASCWAVTLTASDALPMDGNSVALLQFTLAQVMSGRTFLSGENLQAIYRGTDGVYYRVAIAVENDVVTVAIPYLMTEGILFFPITSGTWSAGDGYDYLAIGNSITLHPPTENWPDAFGMGATSAQNDYYHLVCASLEAQCKAQGIAFNTAVMNYVLWEISPDGRDDLLYILDSYLSEDLELVSVQLGENAIGDPEGFARDFPTLISYIRERAPNAEIILIGNFWADEIQEVVKLQCAATYDTGYVDLSMINISVTPEIVTGEEELNSFCYSGERVYDADGVSYVCTERAVYFHPNNAGMRVIAQNFLQVLAGRSS